MGAESDGAVLAGAGVGSVSGDGGSRVWPRYSRQKQVPCYARDSRKTACLGRRALQDTGCFLAGVDGRGFSLESGGKTAAVQSAAVAAVDKGEGTQRGTVLGVMGGHGSLQKERLDLGFFGEPRGGEAHF